ncbi:MAG: hypothetical protein KC457_06940 [Myxococcales bacterium]|nr:hypothetical protein [Myxococcales bacterium]
MADFEPRELDLLEDALEDLEHFEDLEDLELSPALTERLGEYRDVLALCRQSFPLEEPSDAVLVDVLAEAREVSRRPVLRDGGATVELVGWRRVWERWRGTLIPGLALAGTAAVVLWVLDPDAQQDLARVDEATSKDDAKELEQPNGSEHDDAPSEAAGKSTVQEPTAAIEPTPTQADDDAGIADDSPSEPAVSKKQKLGGGGSSKSAGAKPTPTVEPAPPAIDPLDKEETWDLIAEADAARRQQHPGGRAGEGGHRPVPRAREPQR